MSEEVREGDRVAAEWSGERPVAGTRARELRVVGTVAHVQKSPERTTVYVDPESPWDGPLIRPRGCKCGRPHVGIVLERVVEVRGRA